MLVEIQRFCKFKFEEKSLQWLEDHPSHIPAIYQFLKSHDIEPASYENNEGFF
ncbi:MAG: hypothetical protein ABMA02_09505 [Saprospiraceae bacterium]